MHRLCRNKWEGVKTSSGLKVSYPRTGLEKLEKPVNGNFRQGVTLSVKKVRTTE